LEGGRRAKRVFAWIARNPLKSPESVEGFQENPSLFALEFLPFSLDSFGLSWIPLVELGFVSQKIDPIGKVSAAAATLRQDRAARTR
jgi:hypothetical protein